MKSSGPVLKVHIPGQQRRKLAEHLYQFHSRQELKLRVPETASERPIRVVCISDKHNNRPDLPDGDVLIHVGDLTENGNFA
jgi:hypothetical protein